MLSEAFEVLLNAFCGFARIWSGHHYHFAIAHASTNGGFSSHLLYVFQASISGFMSPLRAVFLVCKNWIFAKIGSSLQKVRESIVFFSGGGGKKHRGATHKTTHRKTTLFTACATVPLRCERHAESCRDTGSTVTK